METPPPPPPQIKATCRGKKHKIELYSSSDTNLEDKAGSQRAVCSCSCYCNVPGDMVVERQSLGDSNNLQDTCLLSVLCHLVQGNGPQRDSSTQRCTGLTSHPAQRTHKTSLVGGERRERLDDIIPCVNINTLCCFG